jgi:phage FluMu protein Com
LPQKIFCAECNSILYEGEVLKSPNDIIKKFDGKCPKCDKKLDFTVDGINISPCEENTNN